MMKHICATFAVISCIVLIVGCTSENPVQVSSNNANVKNAWLLNWNLKCYPTPVAQFQPCMIPSTDPDLYGTMEIVRRTTIPSGFEHLRWTINKNNWEHIAYVPSSSINDPALCSNFDDNLLQVVVKENFSLVHYWRNTRGEWTRQEEFGDGAFGGSPTMISNILHNKQGSHNLEVVILSGSFHTRYNYFRHYTRVNRVWQVQNIPLHDANSYGYYSPTMVQSNDGIIHLLFHSHSQSTNKDYLSYYAYYSGSWHWIQDIEGIDINVRPAVATYNASTISVFVRMNSMPNSISTLYGNPHGLGWDSWRRDIGGTCYYLSATTMFSNKVQLHYFINGKNVHGQTEGYQ